MIPATGGDTDEPIDPRMSGDPRCPDPGASIVSGVVNTISTESERLDRSIGNLTSALGDPTRRAIYIALRESAEPMTAGEVAGLFDIHTNVARHHLDKLADEGFLEVSRRRPAGRSGPGAGRPAKRYEITSKPIEVHFPARRTDHLVDLLLRVVERVAQPDIATVAEQIGREYGRELASEIGTPHDQGYEHAIRAVAAAMSGLGFAMSLEDDDGGTRFLTAHCPFGATAGTHPEVICSLDRGIVSGLFAGLERPCEPVLHPHPGDAESCVTEVTPVIITR